MNNIDKIRKAVLGTILILTPLLLSSQIKSKEALKLEMEILRMEASYQIDSLRMEAEGEISHLQYKYTGDIESLQLEANNNISDIRSEFLYKMNHSQEKAKRNPLRLRKLERDMVILETELTAKIEKVEQHFTHKIGTLEHEFENLVSSIENRYTLLVGKIEMEYTIKQKRLETKLISIQ